MRIYLKGGVWKNSEDEILKAAVMKYGLNNWSRVASLLVRKSAKQCKCRWYDWLDPHVKKTEWTREEEEKLLHLAKLFPTQWRTIAPIVGRTAHQCLEHYEKLLDQVQGRLQLPDDAARLGGAATVTALNRVVSSGGGQSLASISSDSSSAPSTAASVAAALMSDPRRLRPGEIDPNPESKPSRADPVDMDEDEKEMLSEARARLANTRGKKAKRKAREKQLEEARRLASLQKKRELKAAGISVGSYRRNRKFIDHGKEIAFEQKPPTGFYDVPSEEVPESNLNFANISLQQLEGKRRSEEEQRMRKDDARKLKRLQRDDLPKAMEIIEKLNDPQAIRKRTKLSIPTPQLSEDDLLLLTSPSDLAAAESQIQTPSVVGSSAASTPFPSSRPHTNMLSTPGTKLTNETGTPGSFQSRGSATPTSSIDSRANTPYRDDESLAEGSTDGDQIGRKAREHMLRLQIKTSLANLPQPVNEIEAKLPDVNDTSTEPVPHLQVVEEDMEDTLRKKEESDTKKREEAFKRESQVIQKNLPRPHATPKLSRASIPENPMEQAEWLLEEEMIAMLANDAIKYPIAKSKPPSEIPKLTAFTDEELYEAREMLASETDIYRHMCEHGDVDEAAIAKTWEDAVSAFMYSPSQKKYVPISSVSTTERLESLIKEFESVKGHLSRDIKRTTKMSAKHKTHTDGYVHKLEAIIKIIDDAFEEHKQLSSDLLAFRTLQAQEAISVETRKHELQELVNSEKSKHHMLQHRYKTLQEAKHDLLRKIAFLEAADDKHDSSESDGDMDTK